MRQTIQIDKNSINIGSKVRFIDAKIIEHGRGKYLELYRKKCTTMIIHAIQFIYYTNNPIAYCVVFVDDYVFEWDEVEADD